MCLVVHRSHKDFTMEAQKEKAKEKKIGASTMFIRANEPKGRKKIQSHHTHKLPGSGGVVPCRYY